MSGLYNRYIPQSDGSYRRRTVQEPSARPHLPPDPPKKEPCPEPAPEECKNCPRREQPAKNIPCSTDTFGFLRNFLPVNFNSEDLLIVILLLLMCSDSRDDGKLPLLTLALYLFL